LINALKRDSKLSVCISREPLLVGKGVAALAEQASEHCTEKQYRLVGCNGSSPLPLQSIIQRLADRWTYLQKANAQKAAANRGGTTKHSSRPQEMFLAMRAFLISNQID
jgi:hypothetical protein